MSRDTADEAKSPGFETDDVSAGLVSYLLAALFVGVAVSLVFVTIVVRLLHPLPDANLSALETQEIVPPEPRLQVDPQANRIVIEAKAAARLEGFGWIEGQPRRAHIPIERAMDILARQGWPQREEDSQ